MSKRCGVICKDAEVVRSMIGTIPVTMMHDFGGEEETTEWLFDDETRCCGMRMGWGVARAVSTDDLVTTTPCGVLGASTRAAGLGVEMESGAPAEDGAAVTAQAIRKVMLRELRNFN